MYCISVCVPVSSVTTCPGLLGLTFNVCAEPGVERELLKSMLAPWRGTDDLS